MPDEPHLNDVLPYALQSAIDKKLTVGEQPLMTLTGAPGEGLVVTGRRVMVLREQMHIVGADTEVDCFDHSFEQIRTVCVESAPGGGRMNLVLFTPPPSDEQTTLYFPSYFMDRFESAAARLRVLASPGAAEAPAGGPGSLISGSPPGSRCAHCGANTDCQAVFCAACGKPQGRACGGCGSLVRAGSNYCPACGVAASMARMPVCGRCGSTVAPHHAFCTACGHAQGAVCPACRQVAAAGWACCARCGHSLAPPSLSSGIPGGTLPIGSDTPTEHENPAKHANRAAEEHNARGMSLYEQERYEEAAAEFEAALGLAPGSPLYHCNLGVVYAEMDRGDEALEEYEAAIQLSPEDPAPYVNLGYFYTERGDKALARKNWLQALALAPDSVEARDALENLDEVSD